MTAKEARQLNKAYRSRFFCLQNNIFTNNEAGLMFFIEYLKYLRDSIVLSTPAGTEKELKVKIITITAAVAEFEAYKLAQNHDQKVFHWNSFCELLKQNMEDWLNINDSI